MNLSPLPETFVGTRDSLHQIAFFVLGPVRYRAEGRMGLQAAPGGFGTPSFDGRIIRVEGDSIVVEEAEKRLAFRDPKTMKEQYSISTPGCPGINHADFSIDGRYAIFTCEFARGLAKIDLAERKVLGNLRLSRGGMPQDSMLLTALR